MSDPYGALATQRKGDIGVFDGAQWQSSKRGTPITLAGSPGGVTGGTINIVDGTTTTPVGVGVSLFVSRTFKDSAGGDTNAAIWGISQNLGTTQPVGVMGQAKGLGDTVGVYGVAQDDGSTGAAFGGFFFARANAAGAGATAVGNNTQNLTGSSSAYSTGVFLGFDSVYDAGGAGVYAGAAYDVRSAAPGTDLWDVGFWARGGSVRTATFLDEATGVNSIAITGDHSDSGISITNNAGHYQQKWIRTSATASTYGLAISPGGVMTIDDITGAKNLLGIFTGTPGANITALSILEGATPTFRRLRTFDPGAAGINFTAGQLVCVLL